MLCEGRVGRQGVLGGRPVARTAAVAGTAVVVGKGSAGEVTAATTGATTGGAFADRTKRRLATL